MDTSYGFNFGGSEGSLQGLQNFTSPSHQNDFSTAATTNPGLPVSGISLPPPSSQTTVLPIMIESLELHDLLRNRYVRQLHDRVDDLTSQVMALQQRLVQNLERPSPIPQYINTCRRT
jgi:hypothetical protein